MDPSQSSVLVKRFLLPAVLWGALALFEGSAPRGDAKQVSLPPASTRRQETLPPSPPLAIKKFSPQQGWSKPAVFSKNEAHAYVFALSPGDFLDVEVEQDGVDVEVRVLAPGEQLLYTVDSLNGAKGPERVPVLAQAGGLYTVELRAGDAGGSYKILVPTKRKATDPDRRNVEGASAYSRGKELQKKGSQQAAEREFKKALAAWEKSGNLVGEADAAYRLEKLLFEQEAWGDAVPFQEKAWKLYDSLGNCRQEAIVLNDLGVAHEFQGDVEAGLYFTNKAFMIAAQAGEKKIEAKAQFNRGRMYSKQGEYGKGLDDLETALKWQQKEDPRSAVETLNALGNAYLQLGDPDTALRMHQKAIDSLRGHPNVRTAARTFTHLGDAYRKKRNYDRAVRHYLRALLFLQDTGPTFDKANALNNLAVTYFDMGRRPQALSVFRHGLRIFNQQGNSASAAVALTNIGWVLATMRRYPEASQTYAEALAILSRNENRTTRTATYFGLAWAEWQRGNLIVAQGYLEQAIELMETLRTKADRAKLRISYLAGRQDMYDSLVEILMEQHRREPAKGHNLKAFEVSERARSRSLLDDLEGRPVLPRLSVEAIQQRALSGGDAVLLEYFLGEKRSFLWVLTSSTFSSYELPPKARIEKLSREVHTLLGESNKLELRDTLISKSIELSRILFGPVAGRLGSKKLLIVAPPKLQYIPFGALPEDTRDLRHRGSAWPAPWILTHEIVVEPSATVLAALRHRSEGRTPPTRHIAVLADPLFSRTGVQTLGSSTQAKVVFPPLKFSRQEAEAIQRQAGDAKLFLGAAASRRAVLGGGLRDYLYLHFSTHGHLDRIEPERSAIVLSLFDSEGKPVDGFLRAGEIAKLDLPADLVVLSACQTGLGREIRGEGLVGLTQAFFSAGASRVMVSLWNVDQQPTAYLMERFYQNLFHENLSPAAALKEAQVWMWQQPRWNAPSYWAGFVLQGEWQ